MWDIRIPCSQYHQMPRLSMTQVIKCFQGPKFNYQYLKKKKKKIVLSRRQQEVKRSVPCTCPSSPKVSFKRQLYTYELGTTSEESTRQTLLAFLHLPFIYLFLDEQYFSLSCHSLKISCSLLTMLYELEFTVISENCSLPGNLPCIFKVTCNMPLFVSSC
jgi:hypothetical protein